MLVHYIHSAVRNLWKNRTFSVINICGLAVGILVCTIISLYIVHELSFDRFHDEYHHIYRVVQDGEISGQSFEHAVTMPPLMHTLKEEYPQVAAAVSVRKMSRVVLSYNDATYYENQVLSSSADFFSVFSFRLLQGNPKTVLQDPGAVVLTESLARKYFGDENPVGQSITMSDAHPLMVRGVCADPPSNSHLQFSAIITTAGEDIDFTRDWGRFNRFTYARLHPDADVSAFKNEIKNLVMERMGITFEETGMRFLLDLEPIRDIRLYSRRTYNLGNEGNITYVYVFSAISLFILIIAIINFINISTANFALRSREVGVRKVIGASRATLIHQFLTESIITAGVAGILAWGGLEVLSPVIRSLIGIPLSISTLHPATILLGATALLGILGIVAGYYPAVYLAGFSPITAIKGGSFIGKNKSLLRNGLVLFQFIISITLICSTLVIYRQLHHVQTMNVGFNKEHVLIIPIHTLSQNGNLDQLTTEIANLSGVKSTNTSTCYPAAGFCEGSGYYPEGFGTEKPHLYKSIFTDQSFLPTFQIPLTQGRNFTDAATSEQNNILINETLARATGWENPIGKTLNNHDFKEDDEFIPLTIVGVVKDFHILPLRDKVEPLVIHYQNHGMTYLSIRSNPGATWQVQDAAAAIWAKHFPHLPFDYFYLDQRFDAIHRQERNIGKALIYFTILAIFIASLGLYGLTSYAVDRRLKEIGIRKVLGSSSATIIIMLFRDFSRLILAAMLVAWPLAWYIMHRWLHHFAYHTSLPIWIFGLAGLLAAAIAFFTIGARSLRAARLNPVQILKCE